MACNARKNSRLDYFKEKVIDYFPNAVLEPSGYDYKVKASSHPKSRCIARAKWKDAAWHKAWSNIYNQLSK